MIKTNICILGAGPGGTTTALYLEKMGISSVLIDKATFPRHKTCGEAMRVNVHFVLQDLNPDYITELQEKNTILRSPKVRLIANDGTDLNIHLGRSFGYMGKRYNFDNFLINKAKLKPKVQVIENQTIHKITKIENGYLLTNKSGDFQVKTKLVVFAAGGKNSLQKQLIFKKTPIEKQILGVRAYFKNATFPDDSTHVYFFEELYGGYLWVFPLPNGNANIGLAIKADKVQEHKLNLRAIFQQIIQHERIQPFLKNAIIDSSISGATVELPTFGQSLSGDGLLFVGDSGLAVNPITGFGVGHAMKMGRYAAQQIQRSLAINDFSATALKGYDEAVYNRMGDEVKGGLALTRLLGKPKIVNGLIRFFGKSQRFRKLFNHPDYPENFNNPWFIFKHLFFIK